MSSTLTIHMPDRLRAELEALSRAENKPLSDLVRESLRRYLATERFRRLRARVRPFAEAEGLLSDEDLFDTLS